MRDRNSNEQIIIFDKEKLEENFSEQIANILGHDKVSMYFQNVKEELLNLYEYDTERYNQELSRISPTSNQVGISLCGNQNVIEEIYCNDVMTEKLENVKSILEKAIDCDFGKNKVILESYLRREKISEEQRKSGIFRKNECPLEGNQEKLVEGIIVKVNDCYLTKEGYEKFRSKKGKENIEEVHKSISEKLKDIKNRIGTHKFTRNEKVHRKER